MSSLRTKIDRLAHSFATGVVDAIRATSLEEILANGAGGPAPPRHGRASTAETVAGKTAPRKRGRLARRSADDIEKVVDLVVAALKKSGGGMRSEELQKALQLSKKEIVRPLTHALAAKKIRKTGQKRATTYSAAK